MVTSRDRQKISQRESGVTTHKAMERGYKLISSRASLNSYIMKIKIKIMFFFKNFDNDQKTTFPVR